MNLDSIPGELDGIKRRLDKLETSMTENTEVTREIRDMMIAGKFLRRLIIWWAPIGAAITAFIVLIKERIQH